MSQRLSKTVGKGARTIFRAGRFLYREPAAGFLLLRMAAWVVWLSFLIRFMPLPRVMRMVAPRVRRRSRQIADAARVQAETARLLDVLLNTNFWVFTPTCWKRAPVLHRFLALKGIETRILFGVRQAGAGLLSGHAWLEAGGEPLLEAAPPEYTVTFSFPA